MNVECLQKDARKESSTCEDPEVFLRLLSNRWIIRLEWQKERWLTEGVRGGVKAGRGCVRLQGHAYFPNGEMIDQDVNVMLKKELDLVKKVMYNFQEGW